MGRQETLLPYRLDREGGGGQLVITSGKLICPEERRGRESYFNPAAFVHAESLYLGVRIEEEVDGFYLNKVGILPVKFNGKKLSVSGSFQGGLYPLLKPSEIRKKTPIGFEDARFLYFKDNLIALYTDYYSQRKDSPNIKIRYSELSWSFLRACWEEKRHFWVSPSDINSKNGGLILPSEEKQGWFFHRPMGGFGQPGSWAIEGVPFKDLSELEELGSLSYREWLVRGDRVVIAPDPKNRETHVGLGPPPIFLQERENGEEDWILVYHVVNRENDGTLVYSTEARLVTFTANRQDLEIREKKVKLFQPTDNDNFLREGEKKRVIFTTAAILTEESCSGRYFDNFNFTQANLGKAKEILFISGAGDREIVWHLVDFKKLFQSLDIDK